MHLFLHTLRTISGVFLDAWTFIKLCSRPTITVAAENLFLRKQLGLFIEQKAKPRRPTDAISFTLARRSCLFDRRNALTISGETRRMTAIASRTLLHRFFAEVSQLRYSSKYTFPLISSVARRLILNEIGL
jgi:hypothetical protein